MPNNIIELSSSTANSRSVGQEIQLVLRDQILFSNTVFLKFLRSKNIFCLKAETEERNNKTYYLRNGNYRKGDKLYLRSIL
jgi:hypothetical protein